MWYFIVGLLVGEATGFLIAGILRGINQHQQCLDCQLRMLITDHKLDLKLN